ncbi:MAG: hypothetical protein Ta2D_13110 [Rickettsiales bacterium]|nr:MAG: hypothetical protein Ta2D_13110 [Rickettsiales bacterium]
MRQYFIEKEIKDNKNSINIILVINICIYDKNNTYGQTKTKCSFKYNNQEYKDFSITCSNFYHKIIKMKKAILVISLPPNPSSNQRYYKIVAQIFSLDD